MTACPQSRAWPAAERQRGGMRGPPARQAGGGGRLWRLVGQRATPGRSRFPHACQQASQEPNTEEHLRKVAHPIQHQHLCVPTRIPPAGTPPAPPSAAARSVGSGGAAAPPARAAAAPCRCTCRPASGQAAGMIASAHSQIAINHTTEVQLQSQQHVHLVTAPALVNTTCKCGCLSPTLTLGGGAGTPSAVRPGGQST